MSSPRNAMDLQNGKEQGAKKNKEGELHKSIKPFDKQSYLILFYGSALLHKYVWLSVLNHSDVHVLNNNNSLQSMHKIMKILY